MAFRGRFATERILQGAIGTSLLLSVYPCFQKEQDLNSENSSPSAPHHHHTNCEASSFLRKTRSKEDSFPNFTRHGDSSLLKQYLTRDIYEQLCHKRTSNGVSLEDIIQSGVALPLGSDPPRGLGVYAGDAESYQVFAPLLDPMIAHYHGTQRDHITNEAGIQRSTTMLKRHSTNLDPMAVLSQRPDPSGDYILYTRMRLARSIEGFPFAPSISRSDRRYLQKLIQDCVEDWKDDDLLGGDAKYVPVYEMTNDMHQDLVRRHLLFFDPDEWQIYTGLGRDWPDGRGVYLNDWNTTPNVMIWCNGEDHVRILVMRKGGDLHKIFTDLSKTAGNLEVSLKARGHQYLYDDRFGFLNTCPTNLGTALRASVYVKLVRLGRQPGFLELCKRLKLDVRNRYGTTDYRYTGIFDIANAERLGKSEAQLINIMVHGVAKLIELEKKLENGEHVDCNKIALNQRRITDESQQPLWKRQG